MRVVCVLVIGIVVALAGGIRPARAETLVLVEVPATVESALRSSLAPWGVEIVVVAPAPAAYDPAALAAARDASFVAWRRGDELVLFDAAAASEERRPVRASPDDAEAAAIALSIKAWMGLGPPVDGALCGLQPCPPPERAHRWLVEAMVGVRADIAHDGGASFRYGLAGGARHGRYEGGLRVDLGSDHTGVAFGKSGAWSVTGFGAWARAGFAVTRSIQVLPGVGLGLIQTSFDAPKTGPGDHAEAGSATGFALDAELGARWRRGRVTAGARVGLTAVPRVQVIESRNELRSIGAHVEPWALATMSVAL